MRSVLAFSPTIHWSTKLLSIVSQQFAEKEEAPVDLGLSQNEELSKGTTPFV